jgi:hypothetical protein
VANQWPSLGRPIEWHLELAEQQWLRATEDAYEGIRAVSERRPGNFKGQ